MADNFSFIDGWRPGSNRSGRSLVWTKWRCPPMISLSPTLMRLTLTRSIYTMIKTSRLRYILKNKVFKYIDKQWFWYTYTWLMALWPLTLRLQNEWLIWPNYYILNDWMPKIADFFTQYNVCIMRQFNTLQYNSIQYPTIQYTRMVHRSIPMYSWLFTGGNNIYKLFN